MTLRDRSTQEGGTRVSSVTKAVALMKAFTVEESELGVSSLARRLHLAKSTAYRLASTLVEAGMLEQDEKTGMYRLGVAVFELGALVRRKIDISFEARLWLMALREQTDEAVNLSILDHGGVVRVNFFESKKSHQAGSGSGLRKPAHCTAEGKALLAFHPPAVTDRVIDAGLERRTLRTVISSAALKEELAAIAVRGYATEEQEYELGVCGIAAPVRDDTGIPIAAVGITGPARRLTRARLLELAPDVDSVAKAISERLGYRSPDQEGGDGALASSPSSLSLRSLR